MYYFLTRESVSRYKRPLRLQCTMYLGLRTLNIILFLLFFHRIYKENLPLMYFCVFLVWIHRFSRVFWLLFCDPYHHRQTTNQRITTVGSSKPPPYPHRDVCLVALHWLVDLNRRAYLKCLWLSFLHRSCWESWSCNFRIAFLEKLWKDWALIRMGHGYISSGSGAGIFEVRN